jgi:hypothetical protein
MKNLPPKTGYPASSQQANAP